MSCFRDVGDHSPSCFSRLCSILIRCICIINFGTSLVLYSTKEVSDLVTASSLSDDPRTRECISYFFYGFTASVSVIALGGVECSSRYLILPLWLWDMIRLFFTLSCIARSRTDSEIRDYQLNFHQYFVLLLVCVFVEMYYFIMSPYEYEHPNNTFLIDQASFDSSTTSPVAYNRHFTPASPISTVSEECEVQNSQSRFYLGYLPRSYDTAPPPYSSLVDTAPPPYSSLKSSSASTPVLPAATSFTNVQGCPVGAEFPPEDSPPPYECLGCGGNPPYSPKSYEELQQRINLYFSAHI